MLKQGKSKQTNQVQGISYLVPGLGLSDQDESVGGDDGEAEVDENDGALRADIPAGREEREGDPPRYTLREATSKGINQMQVVRGQALLKAMVTDCPLPADLVR